MKQSVQRVTKQKKGISATGNGKSQTRPAQALPPPALPTDKAIAMKKTEDESFAADLIQFTDDNGQVRFRQQSAINKYNPNGITLQTVQLELQPYAYDALAELPYNKRLSRKEPFVSAMPDDTLVRRQDELLAHYLAANPLVLLDRSSLRDALARWVYAAWFARSTKAREHGGRMLRIIKPTKKGPPDKCLYTPKSLAAAYDDLYEYGTGLRKCVCDANSIQDVIGFFPDCPPLSSIGFPILMALERRRYVLPAPNTVAASFLEHVTGLKKNSILGITQGLRKSN